MLATNHIAQHLIVVNVDGILMSREIKELSSWDHDARAKGAENQSHQ